MADTLNFHDAFMDGLRDTYDAERQITEVLPMLAEAATSPELRSAFESHLEETRDHVARLDQVFLLLDEPARGQRCEGVAAMLEEGMAVSAEEPDDDTMDLDVRLIASVQRVEQYEKAAYTTLVAWADAMGLWEVIGPLRLTLEEETRADAALSKLGEAREMSVVASPRR